MRRKTLVLLAIALSFGSLALARVCGERQVIPEGMSPIVCMVVDDTSTRIPKVLATLHLWVDTTGAGRSFQEEYRDVKADVQPRDGTSGTLLPRRRMIAFSLSLRGPWDTGGETKPFVLQVGLEPGCAMALAGPKAGMVIVLYAPRYEPQGSKEEK